MTANEKKIEALFEELVPMSGAAATVAGEITRAINRICYRNYNDGDHLGVGYGKETCNPAGRYLAKKCDGKVAAMVTACWGVVNDTDYDTLLDILEGMVIDYIEAHPELKTEPNTEDMWDYRDKDEDVDDSYEEDEDYYDEEVG